MSSVIETLDGAVPSMLLTGGMRWVPPQDREGWPADVRPERAEKAARALQLAAGALLQGDGVVR